jgi:2-dehydro-3-deoxy-L-rhamnonate dehydrogenase (NAD+)
MNAAGGRHARRPRCFRQWKDIMESIERVALVTGGLSGLGAAAVDRLREDGLRVITVDIAEGADFVVDISDSAAVKDLARKVGRVDVLINSAGIAGAVQPLADFTDEQWSKVFAVNVNGTFHFLREFVPGMVERGWGRIVNFSSMAGKEGNVNQAAYVGSKAAIIGITKCLGKELATTGVIVNAIAPAAFDTPMAGTVSEDLIEELKAKIPMGRRGRPEEAAELISWLASDKVSFSTGFIYDLSGGRATY